jgi:hypothetical protein
LQERKEEAEIGEGSVLEGTRFIRLKYGRELWLNETISRTPKRLRY